MLKYQLIIVLLCAQIVHAAKKSAGAPANVMVDILADGVTAGSSKVSLLKNWLIYSDATIKNIPRYNRRKHFGSWKFQSGCHNTRALVLIREDDDGVVKRSKKWPCHIVGGEWLDPYTGKWMTKASNVHIDHVIPLKNAYISGGWRWSNSKRCHFGNFLENDVHLLAVSAFENRSKGERDPSQYLPPDSSYHCEYLKLWLLNKKIWRLQISRPELEFIRKKLTSLKCGTNHFRVSRARLKKQRKRADKIPGFCVK